MRLIDADGLSEIINMRIHYYLRGSNGGEQRMAVCYKELKQLIDKQPITYDWIPVTERLPEEGINPVTQDAYVYPVTVDFGNVRDVRYYSFCHGHWYNQGPRELDDIVIAWAPIFEPYSPDVLQESVDNAGTDAAAQTLQFAT